MAIKCFKAEIPELNRTCITGIVELPMTGGYEYIPGENEKIVSVSIGCVNGHPEIITLAITIESGEANVKQSPHEC